MPLLLEKNISKQSTNQSTIHPSINQSINQPINPSINHVNPSIHQSSEQSSSQPNQSTNKPINPSVNQASNESIRHKSNQNRNQNKPHQIWMCQELCLNTSTCTSFLSYLLFRLRKVCATYTENSSLLNRYPKRWHLETKTLRRLNSWRLGNFGYHPLRIHGTALQKNPKALEIEWKLHPVELQDLEAVHSSLPIRGQFSVNPSRTFFPKKTQGFEGYITSWWLNQPIWKKYARQIGSSRQVRFDMKKCLKPPQCI